MKGFIYKRTVSALFIILLSCMTLPVFGQEADLPGDVTPDEITVTEKTDETKEKSRFRNVNIDARMMYGQYNNLFSAFSIIQNYDRFTYQLNSDLKRSNDFGYKNSSFYESEIGFTGKGEITESWKLLPQIEVNNESHGMFTNSNYSREEKDRIIIAFKNEYKPTPSRWDINFGGGQYVHRLVSAKSVDVISSDFHKINGELGWEYIWSASNRVRLDSRVAFYEYSSSGVDNDYFITNELTGSFKLTEYIKFMLGPVLSWNHDDDLFISGKIDVSLSGMKNYSLGASYSYDLIPFTPEDFYFEKKYIRPSYNLPPAKVHHAEIRSGVEFSFGKGSGFSVNKVRLRGSGIHERNNNYYNHYTYYNELSQPEDVLSAEPVPVDSIRFRADGIVDLSIFRRELKVEINYEYAGYSSDQNITYQPAHQFGGTLNFRENGWEIELTNSLMSSVYVEPDDDRKLDSVFYGTFSLQLKVFETFYIYGKIDNLYDSAYSYRDGYPEPGRTYLAGLRIIL